MLYGRREEELTTGKLVYLLASEWAGQWARIEFENKGAKLTRKDLTEHDRLFVVAPLAAHMRASVLATEFFTENEMQWLDGHIVRDLLGTKFNDE